MPTTLAIESFNEINIRERSTLSIGAAVGATGLKFESTQGFQAGDVIYVANSAAKAVRRP